MGFLTKKIYDSTIQLFTLKTLNDLLNIQNTSSLFKVVDRLVEGDVLVKIERNKYVLKNYSKSDFSLANFLYEPSYISFEAALSHYGILSQFPYEITSATIRQTQLKEFNGKQYGYYSIKRDLFWGYVKQESYLIAEKEKAFADQLYLSSKGIKKVHLEEYNLSLFNRTKLFSFLRKFPQTRQFKNAVINLSNHLKI